MNETNMKEINKLLSTTDWSTLNSKDVNIAFTELQERIDNCMNAITPLKTIIIPKHKVLHEPWVTKGLSKSMNKCTPLYKKSLKADASSITEIRYKNYRNCLTKIKQKARIDYYTNKARIDYYTNRCYALKSNMKKLWQLINNIINKSNDKTSVIEYITVNNIQYYGAKEVANQFGKYYLEIGQTLAQKIDNKNESITKYLKKIKSNPKSLFLEGITTTEISKHINKLPSKDSSGYDMISNNLLKKIKTSIIKPLSVIFNLSLGTGQFL